MPHPVCVLICALGLSLALTACGEEEEPPPEPSTAPEVTAAEVVCGAVPDGADTLYDYDYEVIQEVSVQVVDPERDLLTVEGEVNGYPIPELTDDDADQRYTWTPPAELDPLVCRGDVVLRFRAIDLDDNVAELSEIVTQ